MAQVRYHPVSGVFSTPPSGGYFYKHPTNLDGRCHQSSQDAVVVNTSALYSHRVILGTRNPDGADHMVGRGWCQHRSATCCLEICLMPMRCRPVMYMSSVRRHQISRCQSGGLVPRVNTALTVGATHRDVRCGTLWSTGRSTSYLGCSRDGVKR